MSQQTTPNADASAAPVVVAEPTGAQRRLITMGTELLHRVWPGVELTTYALPSDDAVVLVQPVRGGVTLYVAADESVLFAASSLSPHTSLEMFRSGRRTDPAEFMPHARSEQSMNVAAVRAAPRRGEL